MGIFKNLFKSLSGNSVPPAPVPDPRKKKEKPTGPIQKTYRVTGTTYYQDVFLKYAKPNPEYKLTKKEIIAKNLTDKTFYEKTVDSSTIHLAPEPDNPHDPNAIRVCLGDDDTIGYIKAGSCAHLLRVIRENRIMNIEAEIYGGKYKSVYDDNGDIEAKKPEWVLDSGTCEYRCTLSITENR